MITKSCKKRRLKGLVPFCDKLDFTELTNDESIGAVDGESGMRWNRRNRPGKLIPRSQDEEDATTNDTDNDQIQLGCGLHSVEMQTLFIINSKTALI